MSDFRLNLAQFSMGFLELLPSEHVALRGSGTLVRLGSISGILTAAHVWHEVRKHPRIGIYLYPVRKQEFHAITEHTSLLSAIEFTGDFDDGLGPDLAFIRLSAQKAAEIETHSVFLNLTKNEERSQVVPPSGTTYVDAIAGGVEEMGQQVSTQGDRKAVIQGALLNMGRAAEIVDGREAFDRLEFTAKPDEDFVLPSSYGGMSGGGCFRIFFQESDKSIMHKLLGVAFFQTLLDGKADKIICHGPRSIQEKLLPALRERWPEDA